MGIKDFFTQDANEFMDRQATAYLSIYAERPRLWVAIQFVCGAAGVLVLWDLINGLAAAIGAGVFGWLIAIYALGRLARRRASR
jgi:hypothetical protein